MGFNFELYDRDNNYRGSLTADAIRSEKNIVVGNWVHLYPPIWEDNRWDLYEITSVVEDNRTKIISIREIAPDEISQKIDDG